MTETPERIGVYYSHGQNFGQLLDAVRKRYPDAWICAIVPAHYERTERERNACDSVMEVERTSYAPIQVVAIYRLIGRIRALQCDRFIILFKTNQLRLLAALSGARTCECWGVDSRIHALEATPGRTMMDAIRRMTAGRLRWWRLWIHVRIVRIKVR